MPKINVFCLIRFVQISNLL